MVEWDGSCWGEHFNINVQNWTQKKWSKTTKSGFELKGQFNMGCQWRAIWVKVWIKHDCMKSGYELKGQFNMGHQLGRVVSGMIVRIIRGMRISEGQIIRAILYKVRLGQLTRGCLFVWKISNVIVIDFAVYLKIIKISCQCQ